MLTDLTYTTILTGQYDAVRVAMDRVLAAELAAILPPLRVVLGAYFLLQFIQFAMGHVGIKPVVTALVRGVVVVWLLTGAGIWTGYVRDLSFERVPNALASVATGGNARLTAPQQFDNVSMAIDNLVAGVRKRNTSWSVTGFGNSIMTWLVWGGLQLMLTLQAYVWLASIRIMAIAICMGVWLILFEFFERTRGFFQNWIGIVVGVWTFQLAASVFLQISMHSEIELLRKIQQATPSNSVDVALANLGHVGSALAGDALTMLVLPTVFGGAAGVGAQLGAIAAARALPGMLGKAGDAAGRAKKRFQGGRRPAASP